MEYCKCGSIKEFGVCSNRRCAYMDNKLREWIIDGVLLRYTEPVTRKEAEEKVDEAILEMRKMAQKAREDRLSKFLKPYTG